MDDVFNYRAERKLVRERVSPESITDVYWSSPTSNYLYDNLYHDLYLLYQPLSSPSPLAITLGSENGRLQINNIKFCYINSPTKLHRINDIDLSHRPETNDAVSSMLDVVLNGEPNYLHNSQVSLHSNYIINLIQNQRSPQT